MLKSLIFASSISLSAALAACSTPETKSEVTMKAEQAVITGQLTYPQRIALRPNNILTVTLSDISKADAPAEMLATTTRNLGTDQVPLPFTLEVDPAKLQPRIRYSVRGTITSPDGDLIWTTDTNYPIDPSLSEQDLGDLRLVRTSRSNDTNMTTTLTDRRWNVQSITGANIVDDIEVHLNFSADGRVSGKAGCNNFNGGYELTGNVMVFGQIAMTRKMCSPAVMNVEDIFADILNAGGEYEIDSNGTFTLTDVNGRIITAK